MYRPLADVIRPREFSEVVGQEHILGETSVFRRSLDSGNISNMIFYGPSGVGKSSLTNSLQEEVEMETGEISRKLKRGKHTTRHAQIIPVAQDTFLVDTPGFSSLYIENMEEQELKDYFPEFRRYEGRCRFQGCRHIHEPGCAVKEALENNEISRLRYEDYLELHQELKEKRRY